jgi:hypothetical protein
LMTFLCSILVPISCHLSSAPGSILVTYFCCQANPSIYHLSPPLLYCVPQVCTVQEGTLLDSFVHCPSVIQISTYLPPFRIPCPTSSLTIRTEAPLPPSPATSLFAIRVMLPFRSWLLVSCHLFPASGVFSLALLFYGSSTTAPGLSHFFLLSGQTYVYHVTATLVLCASGVHGAGGLLVCFHPFPSA